MVDMPRSPLEGRFYTAPKEAAKEEAVEGEFIEVSREELTRDQPKATPKMDPTANVGSSTVDISGKKAQRAQLMQMNKNGQTLADLFQGDASLEEQLGLQEMMTRMNSPCLICAMPRKRIEDFETDLIVHQIPHVEVAVKYGVTVSDVNQHIGDCIIDRRTSINAGSLVSKYVAEVNEFIARMDSFRLEVDSSMSTESIQTYLSVMTTLQGLVKNTINMRSPDDEANLIVKRVFNPLIISVVRELARGIDSFVKDVDKHIVPGHMDAMRSRLKEWLRQFGVGIQAHQIESLRVYCELTGVDPSVILGGEPENVKKGSKGSM